ncbi:unnamed protein product [Meganyctiphanes norvegica]|uniref:Cuticle protein n=1 Tax=Meganyctiphanes norvegica TaxID=48144 RepID=A0AAV2PIM0_MEGNR
MSCPQHTQNIMKLLVVLAVVAAANCAVVLKSPPSNARIEYEHDTYGRLVEVDIDHFAPVPVAKKAAAPKPAPASPAAVVFKSLPAAPVAPSVQIIGPQIIYHTAAGPTPVAAPVAVVKKAPAPAPAVAAAPGKVTYFKVDDGELDWLDVAYVSYGAKAPAAAPVPAPAPARAAVPYVQVYSLANPSAGPVVLPIDWD